MERTRCLKGGHLLVPGLVLLLLLLSLSLDLSRGELVTCTYRDHDTFFKQNERNNRVPTTACVQLLCDAAAAAAAAAVVVLLPDGGSL